MYTNLSALLCAALIVVVSGCSTPRGATLPERRSLGAEFPTNYEPRENERSVDVDLPSIPDDLRLEDAITLVMLGNPDLKTHAWEIRAREAHTLQSGLWPNPEIGTEIDEFAGTGPLAGLGASELGIGLSQLLPLGGDVAARRRVAASERDLAAWDYEAARLDVYTSTTQSFVAVLAAQERMLLADSLLALSERFAQTVSDRAEAGKVSPLEATRAGVVRANAEIARRQAVRDLTAARKRLSSLWGESEPDFERVSGDFGKIRPVPLLDVVAGLVERNPDVARYGTETELRHAVLRLARARRIPDPVLNAGPKWFNGPGEMAFSAGISIPLPLFDRNQGAIQQARYRVGKVEAMSEAIRIDVQRQLASAYETLSAAFETATTLQVQVLPAASETFEATEEGYREGKFDLLTVLDAQRTLFEATNRYVDAALTYHQARAEVERLIGTPLSDL